MRHDAIIIGGNYAGMAAARRLDGGDGFSVCCWDGSRHEDARPLLAMGLQARWGDMSATALAAMDRN